jgi:hypothetical protein
MGCQEHYLHFGCSIHLHAGAANHGLQVFHAWFGAMALLQIGESSVACCCLVQCADFVENKINTGWLDLRIAANVRAEKPPWELCVIGAAAVRAHEAFACKAAEYLAFLGKGQLPPADISLIFFQVRAAALPLTDQQSSRVAGTGSLAGVLFVCAERQHKFSDVHISHMPFCSGQGGRWGRGAASACVRCGVAVCLPLHRTTW